MDIRWLQRFSNFGKALSQLDEAVATMRQRELSNLEKQGVIQAFEYTYELGWNTLKDYLQWQGIESIVGSRDTIRQAFSLGLIEDGEAWMTMLVDRNRTSDTYNEKTAQDILHNIEQSHHRQLMALQMTLRLQREKM
ncbi:nucleotidyltransferase substrate binding protein [Halomonas sp. McH1-25]|uniref:nucleotidyltransferase substrate binding protein n=1 Tax=unclassified Halomonas TaxID=2609666 RepID=UPI001EF4C811|nr:MULTISPECIES: nucleotidyltransferase substrate binding protein [unclassified Halomonas]MCG7598628.1 nucleotidyltransferase substrate binding protein [Halomonas sp. McH1-25]MCP1342324.1 nucleotidyltransferase substrate binding protein [Halomonas sp. FL8]MCP1360659.1 nucleotidyltransferase substrate binding protein [Halomonas sp. BBD45]MCP1366394.1 nucleotidyltransferase substrate binding protein [Halomonas sp. BBD48]